MRQTKEILAHLHQEAIAAKKQIHHQREAVLRTLDDELFTRFFEHEAERKRLKCFKKH